MQEVDTFPAAYNHVVGAEHGSLWEQVGDNDLIQRRLEDGFELNDITNVDLSLEPAFGFGSAWVMAQKTPAEMSVTQYDDYPSKHHTTFNVPGTPMKAPWSNAFQAFMKGPTGLWYVNGADTRLRFIRPQLEQSSRILVDGLLGVLRPRGGSADRRRKSRLALRPRRQRAQTVRREDLPGLETVPDPWRQDLPRCCERQVCLVADQSGAQTVTEIDAETGKVMEAPHGIGASNADITGLGAYGFKSLWFPAGPNVVRFDLTSFESKTHPDAGRRHRRDSRRR